MDDTLKEGRKPLPPSEAMEQVEPREKEMGDDEDDQDAGQLDQSISVGRKPEVYECPASEIESLRPSPQEMKNG